jgi:hypothetical protein
MSLEGRDTACWEMIISMKNGERLSLEPIRTFLPSLRTHSRLKPSATDSKTFPASLPMAAGSLPLERIGKQ